MACAGPARAECYLQVAPEKTAASTSCPFCKAHRLSIVFLGPRSDAERSAERARREELVAAQIRMLQNYLSEQTTPGAVEALASAHDDGDGAARTPDAARPVGESDGSGRARTASSASRRVSTVSSASVSPRMLTPLPSPELLASSPRAAALLASAELASVLPAAFSSAPRAPPIRLSTPSADHENYAARWERAQAEQLEVARDSRRANELLPRPPAVAPPPRTLEGLVGSAALAGSMAGWSHAEAADVEQLMLLEAIRLSLQAADADGGGGSHAGAQPQPADPHATAGLPDEGQPGAPTDVREHASGAGELGPEARDVPTSSADASRGARAADAHDGSLAPLLDTLVTGEADGAAGARQAVPSAHAAGATP